MTKRKLLKDLTPEDRKRAVAPAKSVEDLALGISSEQVIKLHRKFLGDKARNLHFTWDEDLPLKIQQKQALGYQPCIDVDKKQVRFKTDVLWCISKQKYDAFMLKGALDSRSDNHPGDIEETAPDSMQDE